MVLGVDPLNPTAKPVPVTDYKWTLEEDQTFQVTPGVLQPNTQSVNFHTSYMPVLQAGNGSVAPKVEACK